MASDTRQQSFSFGTSVGYDNNLNSVPIAERLALTLSGNPVLLDVSSEFRAAGAAYARVTGGTTILSVGQDVNSRLTGSITGRFSEESDYDLIQGSARYRPSDASDVSRWNTTFGLDHLVWGGNTVFSSATIRASFLLRTSGLAAFIHGLRCSIRNTKPKICFRGTNTSLVLAANVICSSQGSETE